MRVRNPKYDYTRKVCKNPNCDKGILEKYDYCYECRFLR